MMRSKTALAITAAIALMSVIACGGPPSATPDPTTTPTPTATDDVQQGASLFLSKGCSSCHGLEAEGGIGPALPGHTREQVFAQVRNPKGAMPSFSVTAISDAELGSIAAFIVSLEGEAPVHHGDDMMDGEHMR